MLVLEFLILGREVLEALHAVHEPALQVHHLAGAGKVARHLDIGPFEDAGTLAKVALFEGDLLGTPGLLEEDLPLFADPVGRFILHHHEILLALGQIGRIGTIDQGVEHFPRSLVGGGPDRAGHLGNAHRAFL